MREYNCDVPKRRVFSRIFPLLAIGAGLATCVALYPPAEAPNLDSEPLQVVQWGNETISAGEACQRFLRILSPDKQERGEQREGELIRKTGFAQ